MQNKFLFFSTVTLFCGAFISSCEKESKTSPQVVSPPPSSLKIDLVVGQNYGGGIIFYLDTTTKHGFIAAVYNQSVSIQWYNRHPLIT